MKIKTIFPMASLCVGSLYLSLSIASAANIYKADVPDNLNLDSSWTGGGAPGAADVAVWDHTVVNNLSSSPGANLSWGGIQILDPAGLITINDDGNILTNGASGIDMSAATNSFTVNCGMYLGASQTWNVDGGQIMTIGDALNGDNSNLLTLNGAGTVNFNATVDGAFAGNISLNGGVMQINSANANNNSAMGTGVITNNGATLRFASGHIVGNALVFNGNCVVDAAGVSTAVDGAWSGAGTVLITNLNSSGLTLTAGGNGNGGGNMNNFTGTILIADTNSDGTPSAGNFRFNNGGSSHNLGNPAMTLNLGGPNSSVAFTEKNSGTTTHFGALIGGPNTQLAKAENYVIGEANLDTTFAGTIQSSSSLTKMGTGTFTLTGNNPYTGTTTVSAGTLQIGDGVTPGTGTLGTGDIVNNATLVFNRPDDFEVDNAISGTGTTIKENTDTLTYGGTNSSSGTLLINQGTLALNSVGAISSSIFVAAGANFDVTQNSTFTLGSTLSGFGGVTGTLTASGGTISPGDIGASGTLTFSNGLTELGGVTHQMELSAPDSTNDQIVVDGDLNLSGRNPIVASTFGGGEIPVGVYPLISYTGNLNGALTNLSASIVGGFGELTNPPGEIALIVTPPPRGPTNLTWVGDNDGNAWDINTSTDWVSSATLFTFLNGDSVTFDNSGSANPTVNVSRTVLPASVTVSASSDYTFTGSGDISGSIGLAKSGAGTLTVMTTNSYT
ncbi:MAG: beta strand repeat-containing protein, partial [Limisphaerales bacterium]